MSQPNTFLGAVIPEDATHRKKFSAERYSAIRVPSEPVQKSTQVESDEPQKRSHAFKTKTPGDYLFTLYLVAFGLCMLASAKGIIPDMPWEVRSLKYHADWMRWMNDNTWVPLFLTGLYLALTFGTKAYLKDKQGFSNELRRPLALWSVLLAIFSFVGALRTVPVVVQILLENGMRHLVCGDTRSEWIAEHPAGFWTLLFCLSKIPELIDTAFIVLRKKPLITLHWYHHFTVMLFCWNAWATMSLNGIIFAAMNLTVHAVMYAFYALAAIGMRPNSYAMLLTLSQITQMAIGTAVTIYVFLDKTLWHPQDLTYSFDAPQWVDKYESQPDSGECHMSARAAVAGSLMYMSYFVFFLDFFVRAYFLGAAKEA